MSGMAHALKDLLKIKMTGVFGQIFPTDPQVFEIMTGLEDVQQVCALIAAAGPLPHGLGSPKDIAKNVLAAIYQDDDAHDTCSLTACLNPLHPGPCKGWKGTLFKTAPGAWHSLEAAKVEKANATRLKKIADLKAANKPIPKKLLTPIVAKPHPHAGQTANKAGGEAHIAGQEVTQNAGVKVNAPGKVTLAQATKQLPVQKGPKGKKPTVASKGIAFVIAQEKVTPQYKLDKAAAITPQQWNALSGADKATIRGELAKIKIDGFGPQQKKADELLAKLAPEGMPVGALKPGTPGTITTPSGKTYQKISLKEIQDAAPPKAAPPKTPEKPPVATEVAQVLEKAKAEPPKVTEAVEVNGGPTVANQAIAVKAIAEAVFGPQAMVHSMLSDNIKKMRAGGKNIEDHAGFPHMVDILAQAALKQATADKMPDNPGITEFNHQIRDHIKEGKPGLPPIVAKMAEHHESLKPENVKKAIEKAAKDAAAAQVVEKAKAAGAPKVTEATEPDVATSMTPVNLGKLIHKQGGSAVILIGGKKITVGFEGGGHEAKLTFTPGLGSGTGHYTVTTKDGEKYQIGKGESVQVLPPSPAVTAPSKPAAVPAADKPKPLPAHVQNAIDMANGTAPGATWSKNHLTAYQPLSGEEFDALPKDVQGKIVSELHKATTKFLDPKKVVATKALLAKFGHGDGSTPAPEAPKIVGKDIGFSKDLHNHAITPAQAKDVVEKTPTPALFLLAKQVANVDSLENPDSATLQTGAVADAKNLVDLKTNIYDKSITSQPDVVAAKNAFYMAATKQAYAEKVADAKHAAFNKVNLASKKDGLSPIEKAGLVHYGKYLLKHNDPQTDTASIDKLKADTKQAGDELTAKLQAALKQVNAPKPTEMSPAQIEDRTKELVGPLAADLKPTLSLAELQYANKMGKAKVETEAQKYPQEVLDDPTVAAKMAAYASVVTQLNASKAMQHKVDDHIKTLHMDTIKDGQGYNGQKLTAADEVVIKKHAAQLISDNSFIDKSIAETEAKLPGAQAAFLNAADKALNNQKAAGPATLDQFDQDLIGEVYRGAWRSAATKAVTYGIKTYGIKTEMSNHAEYPQFKQDLGDLQQLAGKLAVATAQARTAKSNVPLGADGAMEPGAEKKAWLDAVMQRDALKSQFDKTHKQAQARLDTIRLSVGLKKRALPKLDSPAVKTAAAESAYYKVGGYGKPLYGKPASAKQYLVAKLGTEFATPHLTSGDKAAVKAATAADKAAKLKASLPPMPAAKTHVKPPSSEAGKGPNPDTATKLGYHYTAKVAEGDQHGWPTSDNAAYVASPEALADLQVHLAKEDTKHGLAAQKEFKWSINNMEGKGASSSGKSALYSYTGSSYQTINDKLNNLPPGTVKTGSNQVSSIDAAFAASPPLEGDVILYRGFSNPQGVFKSGKWNDVNVSGVEWSQRSYSSTSGSLSTAQSFAGYGGVVMRVIIPKEMGIKGINAKGGQHPGENEIILERGIRYRVVADYGKGPNDSRRYIDVMVVPNPYDKPQ